MPVTAPVGATPTRTYRLLSVGMIDRSGDKRSTSFRISSSATIDEVTDYVADLGAATSANVYEWSITDVYSASDGADATDAAAATTRDSVYDNIAILFKDVGTGQAVNVFIPAPVPAIMDGDSVETDDAIYIAVRNAADELIGGNFAPQTARFTERREINSVKRPA